MLNFVKKFFVFKNKKLSISNELAKEFLKQLSVGSLLDLTRNINEIYLQKGLFRQIDGFIASIGKPGQGKSSLCS